MIDAKELAMRPKKVQPKDKDGNVLSHGRLRGLNNDDHRLYLTQERGDGRYYTKRSVNSLIRELPEDFYTKKFVDDLLAELEKSLIGVLDSKADTAHTHETKHNVEDIHELVNTKADENHVHIDIYSKQELQGGRLDWRYYTEQEVDKLLEDFKVLLKDKSQIGHKHTGYYTKESLNSGQLNKLYYTRNEIDLVLSGKIDSFHEHDGFFKKDELLTGALDVRYYKKDDADYNIDATARQLKLALKAHDHRRTYYSKAALDKGSLDKRYHTKAEVSQLISDILSDVGAREHTHRDYLGIDEFKKSITSVKYSLDGKAELTHDHPEILDVCESTYCTEQVANEKIKAIKESIEIIISDILKDILTITGLVEQKANAEHEHKHGDMFGLVEDNHPQYILASGDRELIDDWDVGEGKSIKTDCLQARSDVGLRLLNENNFGIVIKGDNQIGLGTEPVDDWPATILSNPSASAGLLITDTQGNQAYIRSSQAGVWFGALSDNKVLFTVGGTTSNNVFLECGKDKVLRVPERLMLKEGTSVNEFSVDGTLSGNSSFAVPTEKAVKMYVDQQISSVNSFVFKTRHGKNKLQKGSTTHTIYFDKNFESDDYVINISIVNTDETPKFYNWVVTSLTEDGFSIAFSEKIASKNCEIHWTAIHN